MYILQSKLCSILNTKKTIDIHRHSYYNNYYHRLAGLQSWLILLYIIIYLFYVIVFTGNKVWWFSFYTATTTLQVVPSGPGLMVYNKYELFETMSSNGIVKIVNGIYSKLSFADDLKRNSKKLPTRVYNNNNKWPLL